MKISKTVDEAIRATYALLASAAAKRAVLKVQLTEDPNDAERYMRAVERWLARAGANATNWSYRKPQL